MKKIRVIVAICFIIAIVGSFIIYRSKNGEATANTKSQTATVERGNIKRSVECTGSVISNLDVEITCKASGEIINLPYDISDSVEKGALIAELDPADEERNVKQAEVQLSSSKAKLIQAKNTLETSEKNLVNKQKQAETNLESAKAQYQDDKAKAERMKILLEKNHTSQEEYETAETKATLSKVDVENAKIELENIEIEKKALETKRQDVAIAKAQVENDEISLEQAKQRLDDTKVYAPISGVVSERNVQSGQIISSPMNNVGGGTVLMTLSDLSRMFVLASVDESEIGGVKVDQKAIITVDAFQDSYFPGEVVRIATQGENISNVVTFEVKIEVLGNGKEKLKPKMTANVEIIENEKNNVLVIPVEAVQKEQNKQFVLIHKGDEKKPERKEIETGVSDDINIEVINGLKEGEAVLSSTGSVQSRWAKESSSEKGPPGGMPPPMMMNMARRGGGR